MDDGQQELNPQEPEENNEPESVDELKALRDKKAQQNPSSNDANQEEPDTESITRLEDIRKRVEMAKKIQAFEANSKLTAEQKALYQNLRDKYSKENNTVSLEEEIKRNFTPEQIEELKAFQEIYDLENTWHRGREVLDIRDYFYEKATSENGGFESEHLPTGEQRNRTVKPWEGEGSIRVISFENNHGGQKSPGSVQIEYEVEAPGGNHINKGRPTKVEISATIRGARSKDPQNEGRLYIISKQTNRETKEEEFRQFDSEKVKPLKEGDMTQDEAMATLKLIVDAYEDSVESEEGVKEKDVQDKQQEEIQEAIPNNIIEFPNKTEQQEEDAA